LPLYQRRPCQIIGIKAKRQVADSAARAEAKAVIDRWNEQLAAGRDICGRQRSAQR
jgi:hypothetical protein